MANFLSKSLAYLRGRWHAGLEFKSGHRHKILLERLGEFEARLTALDGQTASALRLGNERIERLICALCEDNRRRIATARAELGELVGAAHDDLKQLHAASASRMEQSVVPLLEWRAEQKAIVDKIDAIAAALNLMQESDHVPQAIPVPTPLALERRTSLEQKGLFLIGCARSGTTILSEVLNMSRDVHLLMEAFLYEICTPGSPHAERDFVELFNARHVGYGNVKAKGAYAPRRGPAPQHCLDYLAELGRDYRFVGEKVAIGACQTAGWEDRLIAFHSEHFFQSHYVLIARRPAEAIWSMSKMFPTIPVEMLIDTWLGAFRVNMEVYLAFPNTRYVFFENLETSTVSHLANWLETQIEVPPQLLNCRNQSSSLNNRPLPEALQPFASMIEACDELYQRVKREFCPRRLTYVGETLASSFMQSRRRKLDQLRAALVEPAQVARAA